MCNSGGEIQGTELYLVGPNRLPDRLSVYENTICRCQIESTLRYSLNVTIMEFMHLENPDVWNLQINDKNITDKSYNYNPMRKRFPRNFNITLENFDTRQNVPSIWIKLKGKIESNINIAAL